MVSFGCWFGVGVGTFVASPWCGWHRQGCSDLMSCKFGSTVADAGMWFAGGRSDAKDGGSVVVDSGEDLSSVLAGAGDGDAFCVVPLPKGITEVKLLYFLLPTPGETLDPWIGWWRRFCAVSPLGTSSLELRIDRRGRWLARVVSSAV